jgi:RNA polymerase sigma-70 factor (ECF subfamily)
MTADAVAARFAFLATDDETRVSRSRPHAEDREAIEACQRGEREAFDGLVERYQRDVYRLCYRYVNNHHDASDLAQESFLKAYRAIGRFRGDSAFSTWLYRIAVNTCLNFRAARKLPSETIEDDVPDATRGVASRMEQDELSDQVREAVSRLPEKQRATLILKIYNDLTHEEVAQILGSSVGTVKANLFHALGNLRKAMGAAANTAGTATITDAAKAGGSRTGE